MGRIQSIIEKLKDEKHQIHMCNVLRHITTSMDYYEFRFLTHEEQNHSISFYFTIGGFSYPLFFTFSLCKLYA